MSIAVHKNVVTGMYTTACTRTLPAAACELPLSARELTAMASDLG